MEKSLLEIFLQTYPTAKGPQNPRTWESTNTPRSQVAFLLFIRSNFMKCTNLKPEPVPGSYAHFAEEQLSTTVPLGNVKWQRGQTLASARKTAKKHTAATVGQQVQL